MNIIGGHPMAFYELNLIVEDGGMRLPIRRGWFVGVPLPQFLLPRSDSREYSENGSFRFDITLSAPLAGDLIVRYRGYLKPESTESAPPM